MYGALTLYSPASHPVPLIAYVTTSQSYNPDPAVTGSVWANPRSLATTCGITVVFSSYAYLDVSVQRVRLPYKTVCHAFSMTGCPIRKSADQFVCADPRGLSQLVASFFASGSLGIPRVPLFTFFRPLPLLPSNGLPSVNIWPKPYTNFLCPLCLSSFLYQYVKELFSKNIPKYVSR